MFTAHVSNLDSHVLCDILREFGEYERFTLVLLLLYRQQVVSVSVQTGVYQLVRFHIAAR